MVSRVCVVQEEGKVLLSKIDIQRKLNKNEAQLIEHGAGKSEIWKLFGKIAESDAVVKGFVACKACKNVYMWQDRWHTDTSKTSV